jgi:hypothetical protein
MRMHRFLPLLLFAVAACNFHRSNPGGSSVTVTLPPPKAMAAPGFSSPVTEVGQ